MSESDADNAEQQPTLGTYDGERSATGERHGQGSAVFTGGDTYVGSYYAGKRHGHGTYTWGQPRARYTGDYVDSWRHGQGNMSYPDGGRYSGGFMSGKRHGYGVYVYPNGDMYAGDWGNNCRHGQGTYTFHLHGSKQRGLFVQGHLQGIATVTHADHTVRGIYKPIHAPAPRSATDDMDPVSAPQTTDRIIGSRMSAPFDIVFHGNGIPDENDYSVTSTDLDQVGMAETAVKTVD